MINTVDSHNAVYAVFTNQMSERESEAEFLRRCQTLPEALSSVVPVTGESFCQCAQQEEVRPFLSPSGECLCGEEDQGEKKPSDSQTMVIELMLNCLCAPHLRF